MTTRSQRIMGAASNIRSTVDARAKWVAVPMPGGLEMQTRYAFLDSHALHEVREMVDALMEEARKMERKR